MVKLHSITDLAHYCLRNLGGGINDVEVTEEQMHDRITEALEFFIDRHYDGVDEVWFAHQLSAEEAETGLIRMPGKMQAVLEVMQGNVDYSPYGVSIPGIGVISYNLQPEDIAFGDNGYGNLTGYYIGKSYLNLMNDMFRPSPWISYNGTSKILRITGGSYTAGQVVMVRGYEAVDPDEETNVYNDKFVKKYATALIKRQWGANLKKYSGIELPGEVRIDGQRIYDEAMAEIDKIEEDFEDRYEMGASLFIG